MDLHPQTSSPPRSYRFGPFELVPAEAQLLRDGRVIPLQPQPLKVLTLLVRDAGQLVERGRIVESIWGEATHVDYDRGLNYCIRRIRSALEDDASAPRFVETVPRHGYRFVAAVEIVPGSVLPEAVSHVGVRRWGSWFAGLAAASALVLVVAQALSSSGRAHRPDPRAVEAFLQGQALEPVPQLAQQRLAAFERAVAIDPDYALAHVAVARTWTQIAIEPDEALRRSRAAAEQALQLDPGLAAAHAHLGALELYGAWDWEAAEARYRRAVALQPGSASLHRDYAALLSMTGRHDAAIREIEQAIAIDPAQSVLQADAGWFYYQSRRLEAAERLCRTAAELDPQSTDPLWCLLQTYRLQRRADDQLQVAQRLAALQEPQEDRTIDGMPAFWNWYVEWLQRRPERASPTRIGLGYLALGQRERALDLFEQAYDRRSTCVLQLGADPQVDGLRGDPRFDALIAKIGLPPRG